MKHLLEETKPVEKDTAIEKVIHDFDSRIESGFQLATFQGPLCGEPVEGMAFFVESVDIDREGLDKEMGLFLFHQDCACSKWLNTTSSSN